MTMHQVDRDGAHSPKRRARAFGVPGQNEWGLNISTGQLEDGPPGFFIESGTTEFAAVATGFTAGMNTWYHLVGVRDGDFIRIYVDGQLRGSTFVGNVAVNNVGRDMFVAMLLNTGVHFVPIDVADLMIYRRALNAAEVAGLHALGCEAPPAAVAQKGYRSGFNGKENDNEVHGATGTFQDYGMRAYDTRVGRFISVDPIAGQYPWYTPYQFAGNKPIWAVDLDGLEEFFRTDFYVNGEFWKTNLSVASSAGMTNMLPTVQRVHNSRADIDGNTVTVIYLGSDKGSDVLTSQEKADVYRRTRDADGKVSQYGVRVNPPGFAAFEQTNQSSSNLSDDVERARDKSLKIRNLPTVKTFNENKSISVDIELPININGVPVDANKRVDSDGNIIGGQLKFDGLIKPMSQDKRVEKDFHGTKIVIEPAN